MRRQAAFMLLVVLSSMVGCGQQPTHSVEGTVVYKGTPLKNAALTFHGQQSFAAITGDDGGFLLQLPEGEYDVTVGFPGGEAVPDQHFMKYCDPEKSPLHVDVPLNTSAILLEIK